jgi:hypothetical protein
MKETQPPITTVDEYEGYRHALEDINAECSERERDVFQAQNDSARLDRARAALFRMYRIRQGILDALKEYERKHIQPQRKSG